MDDTPRASLYLDAKMDAPEVIELPLGTIVVYAHGAPDQPPSSYTNQDSAAVIALGDTLVLAVADGLGGVPGGKQASQTALEILRDALLEGQQTGRAPLESIVSGLEQANKLVTSASGQTTVIVAQVSEQRLRTFNVGDSAALVVGGRGRIKLQTVAHSPVGYAIAAGLIAEDEAMHHEERHVVSNTLGSPGMRIEVSAEAMLAQLDTLVIASDGLLDNLHPEEIAEAIRKGPLPEAATRLVAQCQQRMTSPEPSAPSKPDDLSFVLFRPRRTS